MVSRNEFQRYIDYPLLLSCPYSHLADATSCCFLSACRDHPIVLHDCYSGAVRSSYKVLDYAHEITGASSVEFAPDGTTFYAGTDLKVQIFHTARPGSTSDELTLTSARRAPDGQKGVATKLRAHPDPAMHCLAVSTSSRQLGLYDTRSLSPIHVWDDRIGIITDIHFSGDGRPYLLALSRRENHIRLWDIRNPWQPSSHIAYEQPSDGSCAPSVSCMDVDPKSVFSVAFGHDDGTLQIQDYASTTSTGGLNAATRILTPERNQQPLKSAHPPRAAAACYGSEGLDGTEQSQRAEVAPAEINRCQ